MTSESFEEDRQTAAVVPPSEEKPEGLELVERLEKEMIAVNLHLQEIEELILCRVFHKLHQAYYDEWVMDYRRTLELASRLKKRLAAIRIRFQVKAS
jgi:transcription initiation factor IIF auxiliary subunit